MLFTDYPIKVANLNCQVPVQDSASIYNVEATILTTLCVEFSFELHYYRSSDFFLSFESLEKVY